MMQSKLGSVGNYVFVHQGVGGGFHNYPCGRRWAGQQNAANELDVFMYNTLGEVTERLRWRVWSWKLRNVPWWSDEDLEEALLQVLQVLHSCRSLDVGA